MLPPEGDRAVLLWDDRKRITETRAESSSWVVCPPHAAIDPTVAPPSATPVARQHQLLGPCFHVPPSWGVARIPEIDWRQANRSMKWIMRILSPDPRGRSPSIAWRTVLQREGNEYRPTGMMISPILEATRTRRLRDWGTP